jgi:hypothetical protein
MRPPHAAFTAIDLSAVSFKNSWKRLPSDIQVEARARLGLLVGLGPLPNKLRFHQLNGWPGVYTIDLTSNHAYKASLSIDGTVAVLRRVGSHKQIDKLP